MKGNSLADILLNFLASAACRDAAGEIRRIGRKTRLSRFDNNQVLFHGLSPACFITLLRVPGARSSPGFPGTVTSPSLTACLYDGDFLVSSLEPSRPLPISGSHRELSSANLKLRQGDRQ